jgi:hypothetical protein
MRSPLLTVPWHGLMRNLWVSKWCGAPCMSLKDVFVIFFPQVVTTTPLAVLHTATCTINCIQMILAVIGQLKPHDPKRKSLRPVSLSPTPQHAQTPSHSQKRKKKTPAHRALGSKVKVEAVEPVTPAPPLAPPSTVPAALPSEIAEAVERHMGPNATVNINYTVHNHFHYDVPK